jgi:hypothetical protein
LNVRDCLIPDQTYLFNVSLTDEAVRLGWDSNFKTGLVALSSSRLVKRVDGREVVEDEEKKSDQFVYGTWEDFIRPLLSALADERPNHW